MKKKMFLFAGILTAIAFVSSLIEIIGDVYTNDNFQIKFKQIAYIIGWLAMSIFTFYLYFTDKS